MKRLSIILILGLALSASASQAITFKEKAQLCFYEALGMGGVSSILLSFPTALVAEAIYQNKLYPNREFLLEGSLTSNFRIGLGTAFFIISGVYLFGKSVEGSSPLQEKLDREKYAALKERFEPKK